MMSDPSTPSPTPKPDFKDRSTGLKLFGILFLILGALCLMLGLVSLAGGLPPSLFIAYGSVAVMFLSLGRGSLRARRWCRPLVLILSGAAIVSSLVNLITGIFHGGDLMAMLEENMNTMTTGQPMPEVFPLMMLVGMGLFLTVVGVLMPLGVFLFYRSRHVKATCEWQDPVPAWTDACPVPVLALVVLAGMGGVLYGTTPFGSKGLFAFFGQYLIGVPGGIACLLVASVMIYAAWRSYYQDILGWWILLGLFVVMSISYVMTSMTGDIVPAYQAMGYTQEMIDTAVSIDQHMRGWSLFSSVTYGVIGLAFLLWVKPYFAMQQEAEIIE